MIKNSLVTLASAAIGKVMEFANLGKNLVSDQAIATVQNDPTQVNFANYLLPKDWILNEKGGTDLKIYRRVMMDDQVHACFEQRTKAVTSKKWTVVAGDNRRASKLIAEFITDQLKGMVNTANPDYANTSVGQDGIEGICDQMFYATAYDYSVAELQWQQVEWQGRSYMGLPALTIWDQERFNFSPQLGLQLKTWQQPLGMPVDPRRFWICLRSNLVSTYPPLAHYLYWPTLFKTQGFKFWMTFLDAFGNPTKVGKYPIGTSDAEQKKLKAALRTLSQNTSVVVPDGVIVELLEATRGGTADYESLINQMNGAISKLVLGQTQTTDGGSSYAQSNTHMEVRQEITTSDARWMQSSINRGLVKPLYDYNIDGFAGAAMPRFEWELEAQEDVNVRALRDEKLAGMGIKLTPDGVLRIYGEDYILPVGQVFLNGAQLQALTQMVTAASLGQMPSETLLEILINTMGVPIEAAQKITAPISKAPPQNIAPNPPLPSPNTQIPAQGNLNALAGQNREAPLILRGGEIYEMAKPPDTVNKIADNLAQSASEHIELFMSRVETARAESSDEIEFQERFAAIYESMDKSRQKLAKEATGAFRLAYLAGIAEAEEDAN